MRARRALGVARSLCIYYGIPLRARRLARFYAQFVSPGALCFDVGAHAGNRVRCWRRLGARVVAVEPQPDFAAILRRLYGRDAGVTVVEQALGRSAGQATLLVSERTPTVSSLSADWVRRVGRSPGFRGVEWVPGAQVSVTTLEALVARHGRPRFVKIDVEGYEAQVLEGLETPLAALSFEYLPAAREVALACVDRLARLGRYRFNWSVGESHRLASAEWVDAGGARRFLGALAEDAGSGDLYARLDA